MPPPDMERISARATLPYLLVLPAGDYATAASPYPLTLRDVAVGATGNPARPAQWRTQVEMTYDVPTSLDDAAAGRVRLRRAADLLTEANRLIRWYRVASRLPDLTELARSQLSPVDFLDRAGKPWRGLAPLTFAAAPPPRGAAGVPAVVTAVRRGLVEGGDPPVATVNLLDAAHARRTGRFREAVLHCWGAIDATFSARYSELAKRKLLGEPADTIAYLAEFDVPLKVRMTGMMHLLNGRSLAREPDLWDDLKKSYDRRNGIIHRGEGASEEDADRAIAVARRVVALMESL